ncbi:acetoacetate decarboxylase (ADC) domain-containing [Paramyrothecium foliicola]|nr:acetoacetate decarboxylase (ADC) domain-containing [Paramyrothecium foliicola]
MASRRTAGQPTPSSGPHPESATSTASADQHAPPIAAVPPPWTLRGDVYLVSFWTSKATAAALPPHTYSPLEGASDYASTALQRPVGGLSMVQIIRYADSPVGPYDELILVPGAFEYVREDAQGRKTKKRKNPKITRIYVSQKYTCYNGRKNWNVPKHLAKFDWSTAADGSTSVKVYPHDEASAPGYTAAEAEPSPRPWFQATFKPVPLVPAFPLATGWVNYFGFDTRLVLPPVPANPHASQGELPGTDRWCAILPQQYSRRCSVGWFDLAQDKDGGCGFDNFWPGLGRWQLGIKMDNAEVIFDHPEETWETPKSNL